MDGRVSRRSVRVLGAGVAALLAFATTASLAVARQASPTCTTVSPSLVKSELGVKVEAKASAGHAALLGLHYTTCVYGGTALLTFITPVSAAAYAEFDSQVKGNEKITPVSGLAAKAGSFPSLSSSVTISHGKTTTKKLPTLNLTVYAPGKSIFEISVVNGTLAREEALARRIAALL